MAGPPCAIIIPQKFHLQRQTRDLDFLLKDLQGGIEEVKKYLGEVSAISVDDGFTFGSLEAQLLSHTHMQYPGYSVSAIARLSPAISKSQALMYGVWPPTRDRAL
jgi:hypothetical protein